MKRMWATLTRWWRPERAGADDDFARLILAAKEDTAFRERLLFVLTLPRVQREPLVRTAVAEMQLRGEPSSVCTAFGMLVNDDAVKSALALLREA